MTKKKQARSIKNGRKNIKGTIWEDEIDVYELFSKIWKKKMDHFLCFYFNFKSVFKKLKNIIKACKVEL